MRRIRGKIIAVCTVIAVILATKAALTAEIPVVYAENGSDIDDTAALEVDGEDEQDTELPSSDDGEDEDGEDGDGDTGKTNSGVNSGTDSAADSETDGGNKTDSKPDADPDDAEADSDADGKTEDDTLADAEEELEETLPLAGMNSVFSLRSSRSTETEVGDESELSAALAGESPNVNIKLTNDIPLSEERALNVDGNVTINLNGRTISANSGVFDVGNSGALTITGEGTIKSESGNAIYVTGGALTITGGCTIKSESENAIYFDGNKLTINNGTFQASNGKSLVIGGGVGSITLSGGTYSNGIEIALDMSGFNGETPKIGAYAKAFCGRLGNPNLSDSTFSYAGDGLVSIDSSVTVSSGSWNGNYTENRYLLSGEEYSFQDAECKVSGDSTVYGNKLGFYVSESDQYTFTKE